MGGERRAFCVFETKVDQKKAVRVDQKKEVRVDHERVVNVFSFAKVAKLEIEPRTFSVKGRRFTDRLTKLVVLFYWARQPPCFF